MNSTLSFAPGDRVRAKLADPFEGMVCGIIEGTTDLYLVNAPGDWAKRNKHSRMINLYAQDLVLIESAERVSIHGTIDASHEEVIDGQPVTIVDAATPLAVTPPAVPAPEDVLLDPLTGEAHIIPAIRAELAEAPDNRLLEGVMEWRSLERLLVDYVRAQQKLRYDECERRMRERGATAIPHPKIECTLTPEYSTYTIALGKLDEAIATGLLSDAEKAKLVKNVPEQVIPASREAGAIASIQALERKYAGSPVGEALKASYSRAPLGEKLVVKERK